MLTPQRENPNGALGRSHFLSRMVGASRSDRDPELIMPPGEIMGDQQEKKEAHWWNR